MPKKNWKSLAFLAGLGSLAAALLLFSLLSFKGLDVTALMWCGALLGLTAVAGYLTVPLADGDGVGRGRLSVADAFVLTAAMMYGSAPATLLAALDGFNTSRGGRSRRLQIFSTSAAVVSTFCAVIVFEQLLSFLSAASEAGRWNPDPLSRLLLPLFVLALVRYALRALAPAVCAAVESGEARLRLSRDQLVWTAVTQATGASAAALFYTSWRGAGVSYLFVGVLLIALVYLLCRFNEQRVEEVRRAEAEKTRHIQEMADLHMNTIESLAIAIDAKDQTTHGHVRRTQVYAMELGKLLGVSQSELSALRAGALLHDIGKLAVPEYILNKPGKLTTAEFEKMKVHTLVGGDIIRRVSFPYPVEDIVRFHHEKWDGTGYPKGLKGEQIPLVARIISVVDFYDATRCDRPYRAGMRREDSLALLRRMAGASFDPRVVEMFVQSIDRFDALIADQDIQEQVSSVTREEMAPALPDAGIAPDVLGTPEENSGFRSIAEAQREVFALHEIAQTIGSSLNLQDTVTLVSSKLRAIVPFDTCIIFIVDEKSGRAHPVHVAGEHAEVFRQRRVTVGEGITGWVIANARSMCNTSPELDLVGVNEEVASKIRGVLVSPLVREDGAFGAITLYSQSRATYTTEHVRLLESVSLHASSALNNALIFEKTKESALTDPLTELPNARALHLMLEQRLAECQRLNREPLALLCMDLDEFKEINNAHGHGVGDRLLAGLAGVVKAQLRQMDVLARYAGDEFVALMPMASAEVAVRAAERIRTAVESYKFNVRTGRTMQVGVSIGVACFPDDGETTEHLLMAAHSMMQSDKHARKLAPRTPPTGARGTLDAYR